MDELKSKKWRTMVLSIVGALVAQNQEAPWYVIVVIGAVAAVYVFAQGMADRGKEETKLILDAMATGIKGSKELLSKRKKQQPEPEPEEDDGN